MEKVYKKILDHAPAIDTESLNLCRDFAIVRSKLRPSTLMLRWTSINIEDIDRPSQTYYYRCFNLDGSSQDCSVNYANQQEANEFFQSVEIVLKQRFAKDHLIK
ncbi:MAG: hypothetical protein WBA74_01710 [Cyclobacteriaceae bacterium]